MKIKIRIFNAETNEMCDDPQTIQEWSAGEHNGGVLEEANLVSDADYDHLVFMLYTGRNDEHGEEIYADDIVKQGHGKYLYRVKMNTDGCWWAVSLTPTRQGFRLYQLHHPRIVGNMHEDPELYENIGRVDSCGNTGVEDPC